MDGLSADRAVTRPAERLRPLVSRYVGYRYTGLAPGTHRGLPSPYLTLVISLGPPTRVSAVSYPDQPPEDFIALVGGLHTRSAVIHYDGAMYGVQVDLTPAGARSLLGFPAGDLGPLVVRLADLLGSDVDELVERMVAAPDWPARFDLLNSVLGRRAGQIAPAEAPLTHAWDHIVKAAGDIRVSQVAAEVGWSRRQLGERFTREYGLTVKEACRVLRFHRSRLLIQHQAGITIGAAAAAAGYYDQAHLAREWRELAGCPPSTWLSAEELPFIQDAAEAKGAD